jgi:rhamnogalacturonyl hydrolase YesR
MLYSKVWSRAISFSVISIPLLTIGITQNTKTREKAARTLTPNQSIIENLQNETDILQISLSEKERLLNIKEYQITKLETEVTHLKKQLSTNIISL